MRITLLGAVACAATAALLGCVAASDGAAVAKAQQDAVVRLVASYDRDLVILRELVKTLRAIDRRVLRVQLERDIVSRHVDLAGHPRANSLDESSPLHTLPDPAKWLTGYARAWRERDPGARAERLALLPALVAHDAETAALTSALQGRATELDALAREALALSESLVAFTTATADPAAAVRLAALETWRQAVADSIEDPEKRAAAERALDRVLDLALPSTQTDRQETHP